MFRKGRIPISYWYLAAVFTMTVFYFALSRKDFPWMITTSLGYLLIGILILAVPALVIGPVVVTLHFLRRRRNRLNQGQPKVRPKW